MKELKYYKQEHGQSERTEITYDEALHIMLGTWDDNDMTRDMLSKPNNIHCVYSDIFVKTVDGVVCMAGLWNMLPVDIEYDENGNRIGDAQ